MNWSWFDLAFPWIGVAVAAVLLVVLFGTRFLCGQPHVPRWRDRAWLSWLALVVYLIHNGEEYGIDLLGRLHEFPDSLCAALKQPAYPDCQMPPSFFLAVNIPLFWIFAPLAALQSRRHPLMALSFYGIVFTNALVHIAPYLAGQPYSPGTLTAVILFLPLSGWVAWACFGRSQLPYKAMALLVANGVILHIILMGSMFVFIHGLISSMLLVAIQVINAVVFFLIPWCAEKWRGGVLVYPVDPKRLAR